MRPRMRDLMYSGTICVSKCNLKQKSLVWKGLINDNHSCSHVVHLFMFVWFSVFVSV